MATALTAGLGDAAARGPAVDDHRQSSRRLIESGMFLDDYQRFLALAPPPPEPTGHDRARRPSAPGDVRVEDISFSYPGAATARASTAFAGDRPGETVALVGANGSGKTTLVKLICQLYEPHGGRVLWNGVDRRRSTGSDVSSEITVLFQDYLQYHLPVRDNIAFGRIEREHAPRGRWSRRPSTPAPTTSSTGCPSGYDTRLGLQFEGGHELSVGQWQRLGARPRVLPRRQPADPRRADRRARPARRARPLPADPDARGGPGRRC